MVTVADLIAELSTYQPDDAVSGSLTVGPDQEPVLSGDRLFTDGPDIPWLRMQPEEEP